MTTDDGSTTPTGVAEPSALTSAEGGTQGRDRGAANGARGASDRPRLVASDLDGTLLNADGRVSARTGEVWARLGSSGIETVIVTARPPRWLDQLTELVGMPGADVETHTLAICGNGAFVYDVARRSVIEAHGFTVDEAVRVVEHVRYTYPDAGAAVETDRGMFRSAAYSDVHAGLGTHDDGVRECELADVPAQATVGKILLRDEAWVDDTFVAALAACLGDRGVLAYSGAAGLAEISAPGVTKAARLAAWCRERDIGAADVWAFGDMPNDIPMLTWAGRGIAVANAHPDVVAIADDTCGRHDADGVADYLAGLL